MPVGPPSHRRMRLGAVLREARTARGLTQAQAGQLIGRSQVWINRIENAQMSRIKLGDLDVLMTELKIPAEQREKLATWARQPYGELGVWLETREDAHWWENFQQIEQQARVVRAVHLNAIDALLQTEGYMRRQLALAGATDIEARVSERLARQNAILRLSSPPWSTFLLFEACLDEHMGDEAMMLGQLEHLIQLSAWPFITVLVKPAGATLATTPFGWTKLEFNSTTMRDFVSVEYGVGAATIDDDPRLRFFQDRWETLLSAGLSEHESRFLLDRKRAAYAKTVKGQ